jgi:hypothetical protein
MSHRFQEDKMDIPVDSPRLPFPAVPPKEYHGPLISGPGKGPASVGHHRVIQKLPGQFSLIFLPHFCNKSKNFLRALNFAHSLKLDFEV